MDNLSLIHPCISSRPGCYALYCTWLWVVGKLMNLIDGVRSIILATDANSYHYEGGGGGNFPPSVCDVMHLVIIYIFFKSKGYRGYKAIKKPSG